MGQQRAKQRFDDALGNLIPSVRDLNKATSAFIDMRSGIIRHVLASRPEDKRAAEELATQADQLLSGVLDSYGKNDVYDERDRKLLDEDLRALARMREARQKLFAISNGNDIAATNKEFVSGAMGAATSDFRKAIGAHVDFNMQVAFEIQKRNEEAFQRTIWLMAGFILLVLLPVAVLGGQSLRRESVAVWRKSSKQWFATARRPPATVRWGAGQLRHHHQGSPCLHHPWQQPGRIRGHRHVPPGQHGREPVPPRGRAGRGADVLLPNSTPL